MIEPARLVGENMMPVMSFQATISWPPGAAAIDCSDWPPAVSSCGFAASTFDPKLGVADRSGAPASRVSGGVSHIARPCDAMRV